MPYLIAFLIAIGLLLVGKWTLNPWIFVGGLFIIFVLVLVVMNAGTNLLTKGMFK